jgi:apolipoprotein N-acyltransferase
MVKIIGIEHREYTAKSGNLVKGCNVYYMYPPAGKQIERVDGCFAASVWVSAEMLKSLCQAGFGIGSIGQFQYDKNGKFFHLSGFTFAADENGEVK